MRNEIGIFWRVASACALAATVSWAEAATTLAPATLYSGNTAWQNIAGASYTYADNNHDARLDVGDTVTFSVAMQKSYWGTHRFDAMKVWLDDGPVNRLMQDFEWHYDPSHQTMQYYQRPYDPYSWKAWTGGEQDFSFNYTFTHAGTFDLWVSVMCSRDLSGLVGAVDDNPTSADWAAWSENIHQSRWWLQGDDKGFKLTVLAAPVPEPETYALMLTGLGLLGAMARRRRRG